MQGAMDRVSHSFDNYDLTISIQKTKVVYQPAHGKPYSEPTLIVNEQRLQVVVWEALSPERCLFCRYTGMPSILRIYTSGVQKGKYE